MLIGLFLLSLPQIALSQSPPVESSTGNSPSFPPSAAVTNQHYVVGQQVNLTLPAVTSGDAPIAYAMSPSTLPDGLLYTAPTSTANGGTITGSPTSAVSSTRYKLVATDRDGDKAELSFTISAEIDTVPDFGAVATTALVLDTANTVSISLPTATGGNTPLAYTVSPPLPSGLALNSSTAVITGVPESVSPSATSYRLTATDSDGDSDFVDFTVAVYQPAPKVTGVSFTSTTNFKSASTYGAGESIDISVKFDSNLSISGSPRLALNIGVDTRQATYTSLSNGNTLNFSYTVSNTDRDDDGISIAKSALTLNGAVIRGIGTGAVAANLDLHSHAVSNDANRKVDGGVTLPQKVTFVSSPARGDTYGPNENIIVRVEYDERVTVTGTPQLALTIGERTRQASYTSRSTGNRALNFSYSTVFADLDNDGISIAATALTLNGGTIQGAGGSHAQLNLRENAIVNDASHKVNGDLIPQFANSAALELLYITGTSSSFNLPAATGGNGTLSYSLTGPGSAVTLTLPDGLVYTAPTSTANGGKITGSPASAVSSARYKLVATDSDGDKAELSFTISAEIDTVPDFGAVAATALVLDTANTVSISLPTATGGNTPLAYTVSPSLPSGLALNSSTAVITGVPESVSPSATSYRLTATDSDGDSDFVDFTVAVYQPAPKVTGVSFTSAPNLKSASTYGAGESIGISVKFDSSLSISGSPRLALDIGVNTRQATYTSLSNGNTLNFSYTVLNTDRDDDGISIAKSALTLNGAVIRGSGTGAVAANLDLHSHAVSNDANRKVDGGVTIPQKVTFVSSPARGDTYGPNENIMVRVEYDERVTVTGTPQLALTIGEKTRQASYTSRSTGNRALNFSYRTVFADLDNDGISIAATALALNGGTIQGAGGINAQLNLGGNAIVNDASHKVNGDVTPLFENPTALELLYVTGALFSFNLPAAVSGNGTLSYSLTGPGSAVTLTLPNGISYTAPAAGATHGGTITGSSQVASAESTYTLTATDSDGDQGKLDFSLEIAAPPSVINAVIASTPHSSGTYGVGELITVEITFDQALSVTGSPQLQLAVGSRNPIAKFKKLSSDGRKLTFRYLVKPTDRDSDGVAIAANALALNGATMRAANGINAVLGLGSSALGNQSDHKVDGSVSTYSYTFTQNQPISPAITLPAPLVGNGLLTYTLAGPGSSVLTLTLPDGLRYTAPTDRQIGGTISGTPTEPLPKSLYTLYVRDAGGSFTSLRFYIAVNPVLASAPTGFSAIPGNGRVTLSWADPGNTSITHYELSYRQGVGGSFTAWTKIENSGATTVGHSLSSLVNSTAYTFRLRAVNATGSGAYAEATATPLAAADSMPRFTQKALPMRFARNRSISTVTLPPATGGDGSLTYRMASLPQGLVYTAPGSSDAHAGTITGTPHQ